MIRLLTGILVTASALGIGAHDANITDSREASSPQPKGTTLSGRSGRTIASAVVDFSELAAQEKGSGSKKPQRRAHYHPKGSPFAERAAAAASEPTTAQLAAQAIAAAPLVASPAPAT